MWMRVFVRGADHFCCSLSCVQVSNVCLDGTLRPSAMLGCVIQVGSVIRITGSLFNQIGTDLSVSLSLACSRLRSATGHGTAVHVQPGSSDISSDELMWMVIGTMSCLDAKLPAENPTTHAFGICFMAPGVYEIGTSSVQIESSVPNEQPSGSAQDFPISERKIHVLVVA